MGINIQIVVDDTMPPDQFKIISPMNNGTFEQVVVKNVALEQREETKFDPEHGQSMSYENSQEAFSRFKNPTPAATVEKFTAFKFEPYTVSDRGTWNCIRRDPTGEVVAHLAEPLDTTKPQVTLTLPGGETIELFTMEYRALVGMMLQSGAWERKNG